MVSEFAGKKLGEVLAFSSLGIELVEKSKEGLLNIVSNDTIVGYLCKLRNHEESIKDFAKKNEIESIVNQKFEKTKEKLSQMSEVYIGGDWNDSVEVCEWLGFFEGAAIAHWNIVKGVAESMEDEKLLTVCFDAIGFHGEIFDEAISFLGSKGRENAKA